MSMVANFHVVEFMHCTTKHLCSNSSIDTIDGDQDREAEREMGALRSTEIDDVTRPGRDN